MADNVLGISGSLDISDIEKSINQLYDEVSKIEGISKKMASELENAFTAVGKASKEDLEEKAGKAMEVLSRAFKEVKDSADKNVTKIESTIERLQAKLSKINVERSDTMPGSKTYEKLTRQIGNLTTQIQNQQETLATARENAHAVGENYAEFLSKVEKSKSATDAFNQLNSTIEGTASAIDEDVNAAKQLGHELDDAADGGVDAFSRLEKAAIGFFTLQKAKEFIGHVYQVRSEIEGLETSFRILVGNAEQADALLGEIRKFAVETPMQLKDLAGAAQTMMGFGIATEDVMENLEAIGNVAMGDSQKFQSLALAFSQMSATGKLMGQDLLQMINAGFNPLEQMSRTTGKSIAELKEEMADGAISADMVRQAFIDATKEGGKFNGMLEAQSKTLAGAYSNMQGAIDDMLNEIGQESEGIMSGAIDVATLLAKNYETVGKVLIGLIGTYGTYKVAVMAVTAAQSLQAASTSALTAKTVIYRSWVMLATKAQALLNATMLANPYVLCATAIAGVAAALWAMRDSTSAEEAAAKTLADRTEELRKKQEDLNNETEEAIRNATDEANATGKQEDAMQFLINKYPELIKQYIDEKGHLKDIIGLKERIAELNGESQRKEDIQDSYNTFEDARQIHNDLIAIHKRFKENHGNWSEQDRLRYNQIMELYRQQSGKRDNSYSSMVNYYRDLAMNAKEQFEKQFSSHTIIGFTKTGGPLEQYTDAQLKALQETLKGMKGQETAFVKELQASLTGEDREGLLARVTAMIEARNAPKSTPAAQLKALKQNLDEARKALSDFDQSQTEYTTEAAKTERERLQKAVDDAEKAYKDFGGKEKNGGNGSNANNKDAEQNAAREEKIFEQQLSERQRQAKQREEMEDAIANAAIANEQSRAKRELMQIEKDHKDALATIDRQAEEMRKANYEAEKKAWEAANTDKTKSWSDTDTAKDVAANGFANIKLTEEQLATLKALRKKENADYGRLVKERFDAERQSMRDYLQEYGTYQQQKLAIAEEYAQKIADAEAAGNKWEAKRLTAERDSRIAQANAQSLAMNIDWNQTFQGIGNVLKDIAKETLEKVNEYMSTMEFKGLDAAAKKSYIDLKQQLIDAGGQTASNPFSSQIWDEIAKLTDEYKFHVKALADASDAHTQAVKDYQTAVDKEKKARADLETAIKNQAAHLGKNDQSDYDDAVNSARQNLADATQGVADTFQQMQESGEAVQQQQTNVSNTQQSLHQKTDAAVQGMNNFNTVLGQLTSGTLKGFVDGVSNVIASLTKNTEDDMQGLIGVIGKKAGGIIGAILSIIDMLGDKPVEFFDSLFDGITKVIEEVIAHIPEIIASVVKGVGNIIGGVFSGLGRLFGFGGKDYSAYEAALDKWGDILDRWEDNVKYERELMEKAYGVKAVEASQKAVDAAIKTQQAAKEIYEGWASSGAGWFSHSEGYKANRDARWEDLWNYDNELKKKLGGQEDISRLFRLDWEELERIKQRAGSFWGSLSEEAQKYLDSYIEAGRTAKETLDALNEQLTTTTSENVFDDFLNSLYDLADGSKDVMNDIAGNWQKMVNRMVINNLIAKDFQDKLDGWYKELVELQKERTGYEENGIRHGIDEPVYKSRLELLKKEYEGFVEEAQARIEQFTEEGIIKPIEEAASEAFSSMSDDFKSMLLDMESDATDFGKQLKKAMYEALLERFVMKAPVTVTIDGEQQTFDSLNSYLDNWQERANAVVQTMSATEHDTQKSSLEEQIAALEAERKANLEARQQARNRDGLQSQYDYYYQQYGWLVRGGTPKTEEEKKIQERMLAMQKELNERSAPYDERNKEIYYRLVELRKQLAEIEASETLTDAERAAKIEELNAELEEQLSISKQIAKTYADMAGWTMEMKIDASPLANLGDELLSVLQDTSKGVDDWKKELVEAMTNDLIKEVVYNADFEKSIRDLQEQYVNIMSSDMSAEEKAAAIQKIADAIAALYNTADEKVDGLKNIVPDIDTSPFDNLRDTILNTFTDIEADAKDFRKSLEKTLVKDLLEKMVLDVPLTVTIDGEDKIFEGGFDEYGKDWNNRYLNAVKALQEARKGGDAEVIAEAQAAVDALLDEVEGVYTQLEEGADEFRQRLKEIANDTTFTDMADSLVSSLMDVEGDVEDIANDMKKTIVKKLVEAFMVSDAIKPLLDELQATFNAVMGMEGLTPEQRAQMMKAGFTGTDAEGNEKVFLGIDDEGVTQRLTDAQVAIKALMEAIGYEFDKKEGFSDLRGAFISALTDMEGDASTFGKNIGKTMAEQMLDAYIDKTYSEEIDKINEEWADALASGDPTKIEAIRKKVLDLYAAIGDDEAVKNLTADVKKLEQELDTTFKDMGDSWVSALIDMDSTASDFGRQIGQTLVSKLVKELIVTKQLQKYLDDIQKAYDEAIGKEGATVESVLAAVTPAINAAVAATEKWKPVVEEIAKAFQELDKSTPLSDIRSKFLSQLMDIKSDTKDFAKSINEILTEAFIDKFVLGEEFDKRLEEWEQEYSSIMGGNYSDEERATLLKQLRQAITTAKEGYTAEAQAIHELMGTANYADQQATMNLSDRATYEQADMLLNVNVSQMMIQEKILQAITGGTATPIDVMAAAPYTSMAEITSVGNTAKLILSTLQRMSDITTPNKDGLAEISRKFDTANDRLLAIVRAVQSIKEYVANNVAASRGILSRL